MENWVCMSSLIYFIMLTKQQIYKLDCALKRNITTTNFREIFYFDDFAFKVF